MDRGSAIGRLTQLCPWRSTGAQIQMTTPRINSFTDIHWKILEHLHKEFNEEQIVYLAEIADEIAKSLAQHFPTCRGVCLPGIPVLDPRVRFEQDGNTIRAIFPMADEETRDMFCGDVPTSYAAALSVTALNKFFGFEVDRTETSDLTL